MSVTIKGTTDTISAADGSLVLEGASLSGISTIGVSTVYASRLSGSCLASVSNVAGINTTGVTTSGSTAVTITGTSLISSISNGDYVTGIGITAGTTVSSGGGTVALTLSQPATSSLTNPLTFYTPNKVITPAVIGGQLCRAWVNFNGTGTVAIRAAYNVRSITDQGGTGGNYTVNFTTEMPDANYSTNLSISIDSAQLIPCIQNYAGGGGPPSTSSVTVMSRLQTDSVGNSTLTDVGLFCVSIFR